MDPTTHTSEVLGSATTSGDAPMDVAFYTVADSSAFLGAVGLLNSLRVLGHKEPLLVLDCGLSDAQRTLLESDAWVVDGPPELHPALLKAWAPLVHPARVMVVLDADVIAVRSLGELIAHARAGRLVVFRDPDTGPDRGDLGRYRPEWGTLLGLGTLPQRPYVNSGHFLVPGDLSPVLEAHQRAVFQLGLPEQVPRGGPPRTRFRDDPFFYSDQDVLNAILAANVTADRMHFVESRCAPFPPFTGLRCSAVTLACEYADGEMPYLLHHVGPKPWLSVTPDSVYVKLLRRLFLGNDVPLRVPNDVLPRRFRTGLPASVDRTRVHIQAELNSRLRGRLGIRPRVEAFLARRSSGPHG